MIDIHISFVTIMAWFGVVVFSGFLAFLWTGFFVTMSFSDDGWTNWFWVGVVGGILILFGLSSILSGWAGLW